MTRSMGGRLRHLMRTVPCRDCGEPTRTYAHLPDESVQCEDCSGAKRWLAAMRGPDRSRHGIDPVAADLVYDGRRLTPPDAPRPRRPAGGPEARG